MKTILFTLASFLLTIGTFAGKVKTPKGFVFIPSSSSKIEGKEMSTMAFYMAAHEVTNAEYRAFLKDLKKSEQDSLFQIACPDTLKWIQDHWFMTPMAELYFWHPAYDLSLIHISEPTRPY